MKRNDFVLIGIVFVIAAAILIYRNSTKQAGDLVVVKVGGEIYKEIPLNVDTTFEIVGIDGSTNTLVIKGGDADIIAASCPDKLCTRQKRIHYNGETLVCLPNQVTVEIRSDEESGLDAISN